VPQTRKTRTTRTTRSVRPRSRRSVVVAFLVAALLFMAGSFIAPLTIQLLKPLPTDYDATFRTAETSALVAGDTVTPANADRPECATPDLAPHSCFVDEVAAVSTQHTTTAATDTRTEITAETTRELLLDGEPTARLDDEVRLARSSGYPVSDPVSRLVIDAPGLPGELAPEPFIRTGLQYFFPFTLERRSYDYFDTTAQLTVPLDYVGEGEHNGHEAYELHHTVTAVPLAEAVARAYLHPTELTAEPPPSGGALFGLLSDEQRAMTRAGHTSGPASRFFSDEELARFGFTGGEIVAVSPFYSVERTLWVEPRTGTILDVAENVHVQLATDQRQAEELAFDTSPDRVIFAAESRWDGDTTAQQRAAADEVVPWLRVLQIFAVLMKAASFLVAAWAVVTIVRHRRERP